MPTLPQLYPGTVSTDSKTRAIPDSPAPAPNSPPDSPNIRPAQHRPTAHSDSSPRKYYQPPTAPRIRPPSHLRAPRPATVAPAPTRSATPEASPPPTANRADSRARLPARITPAQ